MERHEFDFDEETPTRDRTGSLLALAFERIERLELAIDLLKADLANVKGQVLP